MYTRKFFVVASLPWAPMLVSAWLAGCGGGVGNELAEAASTLAAVESSARAPSTASSQVRSLANSQRVAAATVQLEGCVFNAQWGGAAGVAVHARTADGRTVGTAFTNARGVYVMRVPAQSAVVLDATVAGPGELSINTGSSPISVAACLLPEAGSTGGRVGGRTALRAAGLNATAYIVLVPTAQGAFVMNTNRRHLLHLAALSTTALALPGHALATTTERSGAPDRKVAHKTPWRNTLSCDNTAMPVSQRSGRMVSVADFGSAQACTMLKDSFEGPFFFCTNPGAADISRGQPGAPLVIALRAINAATCQPMADAVIDVWHCDAKGLYSGQNLGVDEAIQSAKHTPPANDDRHCRGALRTDADGIAEFRSIYPGHYVGRAIHIHFKVHIGNRAFLTNQALLPESDNVAMMAMAPYNMPRKLKRIANAQEADWGLQTMKIVARSQARLAVLDVVLSV
jgi:protocatechuate 3,4-dioxygenase beta subunit